MHWCRLRHHRSSSAQALMSFPFFEPLLCWAPLCLGRRRSRPEGNCRHQGGTRRDTRCSGSERGGRRVATGIGARQGTPLCASVYFCGVFPTFERRRPPTSFSGVCRALGRWPVNACGKRNGRRDVSVVPHAKKSSLLSTRGDTDLSAAASLSFGHQCCSARGLVRVRQTPPRSRDSPPEPTPG